MTGEKEEAGVESRKPIYTLTAKDVAKFCDYQIRATRDNIRKLQDWKATSLEKVGKIVVK